MIDLNHPWGDYAVPLKSWPLRITIATGLVRGGFKSKILHLWKKYFGPVLDIKISGIKYLLKLDDNVTDQRILTSARRYDSAETNMLIQACKYGLFVDLGANIGFYTLSVASSGADVLSIEPNPKALERLPFNAQANDFSSKIKIIPLGVGDTGEFQLISSGDLGSANIRTNNSESYTESVTIKTKPIIEILAENNIQAISGLNIDIEGLEDRALYPFFAEAPKSLWPKWIVIEHCCSDNWEKDIIGHMLHIGYELQLKTRGNSVLIIKN